MSNLCLVWYTSLVNPPIPPEGPLDCQHTFAPYFHLPSPTQVLHESSVFTVLSHGLGNTPTNPKKFHPISHWTDCSGVSPDLCPPFEYSES